MPRKRKRDYKAEYQRRLQRALDKGYSRSIARGHAKKGELGLARAKKLNIAPGDFISGRNRRGYRPAPRTRISRIQRLLGIDDVPKRVRDNRKSFVDWLVNKGLTEHEAYTLWFSP